MAQYGRTWWGEQWLKALDRIDFSNLYRVAEAMQIKAWCILFRSANILLKQK
ncbi:MAG: hypothetical protein ABJA79_05050 [Parafilimonas sp.]